MRKYLLVVIVIFLFTITTRAQAQEICPIPFLKSLGGLLCAEEPSEPEVFEPSTTTTTEIDGDLPDQNTEVLPTTVENKEQELPATR